MSPDKIAALISETDVSVFDSSFYSRMFALLDKNKEIINDAIEEVCREEYVSLSHYLDKTKIQESSSVRNTLRTRLLAIILFNEKGEINISLLSHAISCLQENLYSLGPDRQHDSKRQKHILCVLKLLRDNKEINRLFKNISKPLSHKYAEQIIRHSLNLPAETPITDAHAKRAVLSAWLCYLRQSVGSCFATAPAILIHDEQPELFLKDLNELMTTGRLKRTFGGVEYTVPLSASWGSGDLKKSFSMSRDLEEPTLEIWESPGFIEALVAVEIIDASLSFEEKAKNAKQILSTLLGNLTEPGHIFIVTSEKLLRRILLQHLHITEKDVVEFQNRPVGMIHSGLLLQSSSTAIGGKGALCAKYLQQFEVAKDAFKSLADNALLKAWEFTLASFCDTKADFSRWNLYSSLGLGPQEPGGIGQCLYEIIKQKLDSWNEKVAEYQIQYEQVYAQVKVMEGRARSVSTEKEAQWLKAEYQSKAQEFYLLEEMRDKANLKAKKFANLFNVLIDLYCNLFPSYFQEVYDPDMHDIPAGGQYDDSPAGFRLLYKYGRANTSQWTHIHNPNEFIQALSAFFIATENEIASNELLTGMESDLGEIITKVEGHIKTKEFLETAFYRMAAYHRVSIMKNPLENWEKVEKKPWAYTSGGTMDTLMSCYYRREQKPTEVSRWVENEVELLVFLYDSLKQIPYKMTEEYLKKPDKSMLMHSPTHAFLLKPGMSPFKEGWNTEAYTYVWTRDQFVLPRKRFVENLLLDEQMMQAIIDKMLEKIPSEFKHNFRRIFTHLPPNLSSIEFRDYLLEGMARDRGLQFVGTAVWSSEEVDSLLYSLLPLFPTSQLSEKVMAIMAKLPRLNSSLQKNIEQLLENHFSSHSGRFMLGANSLQNICKILLALTLGKTSTSLDYHLLIAQIAQQLGFAMPVPIQFADSNWVRDYFGFVVNPGTGRFEFWRLDYTGSMGNPIPAWTQWMNGSRQDLRWGIYSRPYEYT